MKEEITSLPIGELIRSMALAVADAQHELDRSSFVMAELMSGRYPLRDRATGALVDAQGKPTSQPVMMDSRVYFGHTIDKGVRVPNLVSMMELGFSPNFYQFVDTVIEVRLALRVEKSARGVDPKTGKRIEAAGRAGAGDVCITSTPIDAGYASAYSYKLEMSSVFKTKLACVPPPAALEERLRLVAQTDAALPAPAPATEAPAAAAPATEAPAAAAPAGTSS